MYNILANAVILVHFLFIVFVVCGGLLVIRRPKTAFVHLPAAVWGAAVEIFGWIYPLTPLENHFRKLAGSNQYNSDFITKYLSNVVYPENLTATMQQVFGGLVILINLIFYLIAFRKHRSPKHGL